MATFITRRAFLGMTVACVSLAACGGAQAPTPASPGGSSPAASPAGAAKPGSSAAAGNTGPAITEGQNGDINDINPILILTSDGYWRTDLMFDALVRLDAQTLKPMPHLATSWDLSADGLTYTFKLRDGVKWHDGQAFSGEDVVFTIMSMLSPDYAGPFRKDWSALEGAADVSSGKATTLAGLKLVDPKTLQLRLTQPDAAFLAKVVSNLKPIPKHILDGQKITRQNPYSLAPVGTGPFKFAEWKQTERFVVDANPEYWGGAPSIKRVTQRFSLDQNSLIVGLEAGDYDYTIAAPPSELTRLSQNPKFNVVGGPPQQLEALHFNLKNPQLRDVKVRQAISSAFDVDTFQKQNMAGAVKRATGFIGWGSWAYDESVKLPTFDMAKAKQLLAEAGHPNGGFSLALTTNVGNKYREEEATILQSQLKQLGIDAKVQMLEFGKLVESVSGGTYDIALLGFFTGYPDPDRISNSFSSSGSDNHFGYSSPEVDGLFVQARGTSDFDKRKSLYSQIQSILLRDLPAMPLFDYPNTITIKKSIQGLVPSSLGMRWNIGSWKLG